METAAIIFAAMLVSAVSLAPSALADDPPVRLLTQPDGFLKVWVALSAATAITAHFFV
ncbi:MAG: hypothetical protein OXK21_05300 [Chloroflexota bacterium]|nr:hypothetical protein [Chloroflexota bacterium]